MQYKKNERGLRNVVTCRFLEADISLEAGSSKTSRETYYPVNSASSALASFKSAVSKPSVNQL